jgi:hypothetical protein
MKRIILFVFPLLSCLAVSAQEASFSVSISPDSLLYGNQLKVVYTIENASGANFQPPEFEGFFIVSGPNHSSSMQIINGQVNQSSSITYYLEPKETGLFFIDPASIEAEGETLNTEPLEIIVHPNPGGVRQYQEEDNFFRQFDAFDPWEKVFPELQQPKTKPEEKPKRKKRKVYKL